MELNFSRPRPNRAQAFNFNFDASTRSRAQRMASHERIFDNASEGENQRMWYPKPFERNEVLVELYQGGNSETFDVEFKVRDDSFGAHKNILFLKCKGLYDIASDASESGNEEMTIEISSVTSRSFKCLLEFIYTVKEPELETQVQALELLGVADRFECVDLKLYVEFVIVNNFLEIHNGANLLLYADGHSLALLKEAAINVVAKNLQVIAVRDTEGWSELQESNKLLKELCFNLAGAPQFQGDDEIDRMDVATLRYRLQDAGLEVDGSRVTLVNRLKEAAN